ncbi:transposase [Orientia tsutsugamushi]|uniref:transposase n=1 Tax=Orientia tsutsugamushi TaxID=784 RepID=UPI0009BC181C
MPKLPNHSVVVIDNSSFHKRPHLKTTIEKDGHVLDYLPFHFPDLNLLKKYFQANQAESNITVT